MRQVLQAARSLRRRPAFSIAVIVTLAFGIGITAAGFALVDTVVLQPLPYPDSTQLATVMEASPSGRQRVSLVAPARMADWNRLSRTFSAISGAYAENVTDTSGSAPERLDGRRVLPRFFAVYAREPIAGRTFSADEERYGGPAAVVISEGLWTRRFARSPSAIGRPLTIGGVSYPIVGVMPRSFAAPTTDVWLPAQIPPPMLRVREARFVSGVGRIRSGVSLDAARAELAAVQRTLGTQYPKTDAGWSVAVTSLKDARVGDQRQPLGLVFAAVALLLAIALANVAGLMLVQLRRRAGEFALRSAIGASRGQVIAAVMSEVAILAAAGAVLGAGLAALLIRVAIAALPAMPRITEMTIDWRVLAFVAACSVAAAAIVGVLPAWVATRRRAVSLSAGVRVTGGHRVQSALVAAQVAIGLVLGGSAALLVRSYAALAGVDTGLSSDNVLTFHVAAAWNEDRARVGQMQERVLTSLRALPGVTDAGFANFLPATGATLRYQIHVAGLTGPDAGGLMTVGTRSITSGYLPTLKVPLAAGRWCRDAQLRDKAPLEAMVNRRFAEVFGGGQPLIGRTFSFNQDASAWTIVGVVGDVAEDSQAAAASPYIYNCLPFGSWPDPQYVVRSAADPRALAASLREIVQRIDPARPVFGVGPLSAVLSAGLDQPRVDAAALAAFAAGALGLVALGVYGLLMLSVTERRREFGVRLALGASPLALARTVLSHVLRLISAGIAAGLLLLFVAARLLRSLLFGVTTHDPVALIGSVALIVTVGLAAAAAPLRRAVTVNPVEALRD